MTHLKKIINPFIFCAVLVCTGQQSNQPVGISGPIDVLTDFPKRELCGLPIMTDEWHKNVMEYMRINYPDEYLALHRPPVLKKSYSVGDVATFYVLQDDDSGGTNRVQVGAKLLAKGNHNAIWADTVAMLSANNISENLAKDYLKLLEESTPAFSRDTSKGIYELETEYFGEPPNKDGDGVVDFLFATLYSGVAGYFSPLDQTNGAGSNRRDIVYIDVGSGISYTKGTLSHELQHLIHYNYDKNENTQFNEGLSEMATIICGGDYISHSYYLQKPNAVSWAWDSNVEDYSMASLFTLYWVEQFGDAAIKEFVQMKSGSNSVRGFTAFNKLLQNHGFTGGLNNWFKNWFIANYVDDISFNPKYGYKAWISMRAAPTFTYAKANIEQAGNIVLGFTPNYILYTNSADSMAITFSGVTLTKPEYVSIETTDSSLTLKELSDGIMHRVDNDSLKVRKAIFIVANTQDLNLTYDFTSSGIDASEYSEYQEIAYDDGTADTFTGSDGSSFGWLGWGDNSAGLGWSMNFKPAMAQNQLVEFKILANFSQDFSGSTLAADADRDFSVHVWKPTGVDGSVEDLITPFNWSTNRQGFTSEFISIDLTPYKDQLKDHSEVYIGIVEDDDVGTYMAMDKNVNDETYTYAFNNNSSGKMNSLSGFEVGGTSLEGWNYMMRATYFYSDTTQPAFKAGFVQNPVFTDELDLYVIANSLISPNKVKLTVTNDGETEQLNAAVLTGNDSILIANQYRLNSTGTLALNVKGGLRYGSSSTDTTFSFTVAQALAKKAAVIASSDFYFEMKIPAGALKEDTYLISVINDGLFSPKHISETIGNIFSVGPFGKELDEPVILRVELHEDVIAANNPEHLSIGYWDGEIWRELFTQISKDGNYLTGRGTHLGHYALIQKGSGSPLATKDEFIPTEYALNQNYPNPFNPETMITYEIPEGVFVNLKVFDILGREVIDLVSENKSPGRYQVLWNGQNRSGNPAVSGIYFYQLSTGEYKQTKKMILAR